MKNKSKLFLAFLFVFFSIQIQAQIAYQWANKIGAATTENTNSMAVDSSGNVYAIGFFSGTVDFDPGTGTTNLTAAGSNDIFIAKYTPSGSLVWAGRIGGTSADYGFSIACDDSANIYFTGYFQGTADFNPGPGTFSLTSSGSFDTYIAKLDSSGLFKWAKKIGGSAGMDAGFSVNMTKGNIYLTGYFNGTVDFDPGAAIANLISAGGNDIFMAKYDRNGNYKWAKKIGDVGADAGYSIVADSVTGKITLTGTFSNNVDFDPNGGVQNLASAGAEDNFIARYDSSGNYLWAVRIGNLNSDISNSLAVDKWSNIYTTGSFSGTIDFDPGAATDFQVSSGSTDDVYILKLDSLGNFRWARKMGGSGVENGNQIVTIDSKVYLLGNFQTSVDLDPGTPVQTFTSNGNTDIFFAEFDSAGTYQWAKSFGGSSTEQGNCMTIFNSTNIYLGGYFNTTVDFNPDAGIANITCTGAQDGFLAKYSICTIGSAPGPIIGNTAPCIGTDVTYSIANVPGAISYTWTWPSSWGPPTTTTDTFAVTNTGTFAGTIQVQANNGCGLSSPSTLNVTVSTSPQITVTPVSQTVCSGNPPIEFYVVAGGTALTYQWKKGAVSLTDGGNISGSQNDTLFINPFTVADTSSFYYVEVSGACGPMATSLTAYLHVGDSAEIQTEPTDQIICEGDSISFSVTAAGSNLNYSWYKGTSLVVNSGSISGAGTPTLSISPVSLADTSVTYYVVVSGPCSLIDYSDTVSLQVNELPVINAQPISQTFCIDTANVQFSVSASGSNLSYQWRKGNISLSDGGNILGSGTATLHINPATISDAASNYNVIITGTCSPPDTSVMASLQFNQPPIINTHPSSVSLCFGSAASFSVIAGGTGLTYQWRKGNVNISNGGNISGAQSATLIINPIGVADGASNYNVIVSGVCNPPDTSVFISLTVTQVNNQVTQTGALLSAVANPALYQWIDCEGNLPIAGATQQNFTGSGFHTYAVIVTVNGCVDTSVCVFVSGVGIENFAAENSSKVYPNPTSGKFFISSTEEILKYEVYDFLSQKIMESTTTNSEKIEVDMSESPNGIYFIKCFTKTEELHFRIIKN